MILQCIMRWSSGLHVTGLELNTIAHAICALLIFVLWWDKSHDIQHPTILNADWTRLFAAHIWMAESTSLFLLEPSSLPPDEMEERGAHRTTWEGLPASTTENAPGDKVRIYNWESGDYSDRTFDTSSPAGRVTVKLHQSELLVLAWFAIGIRTLVNARTAQGEGIVWLTIDRTLLVCWKAVWGWLHSLERNGVPDDTFPPFIV
ncbi:hypothetical protein QBC38DRAFT_16791 [Podospora fimiseda]|uniref:Uncharacterized protein n=1 Tax=Podospora fimiseda TaxID=252190 RepID=A0AAN7BJL7_9PEZI|nr:hypothetical protein QBC38DRAFT_16791 [Podospora fimiseda]